jgi:hypothetical protein
MSNAYYSALRNARPDNFYNLNKLKHLIALANAAGNNKETIAENNKKYRTELNQIISELSQIPQPKEPYYENYKVKGRLWGTNKTKTQKAYNNASAKYNKNKKNYNNKTIKLLSRRNNLTEKLKLISKRSSLDNRRKNVAYYKGKLANQSKPAIKESIEPTESMIDEFKKYGYDYYPSTQGYMTGPSNYVQGEKAYFKYKLSKTVETRNNKNGWTFNKETTHTEHQNRTGYPYEVTSYVYTRTLPEGYPGEKIYESEWESALETLRELRKLNNSRSL